MAQNVAMSPPPRIALLIPLICFCLVLLLPFFSVHAAKRTPAQIVQDLLQQQIVWDESSPNERNPNGLSFQFFKIDETDSPARSVVRYRVYISGIPTDRRFALRVWKIGSDPRVLSSSVYANANGLLMERKPTPAEENSNFIGDGELHMAVGAALGEPLRYSLTSSDKKLLITGTLVPFPLQVAQQGCRLEVRLALPDASAVLIYADGLPPNAEIPFQMVSAGEQKPGKFITDAHGHAVTTDLPFVQNLDQGSLRVTIDNKNCSAAVEIPWGKKSYQLQ